MRWRVGILWMVAGLAGLLDVLGMKGQTQTQPQVVVIRVTDSQGAGVAGAQVRVIPAGEIMPAKTETDGKGELALQLKPGGYAVFARAAGFKSVAAHIDVKARAEAQSFPVVLAVGETGSPKEIVPATEANWLTLGLYPFHAKVRISPEELKGMPRKTVIVRNEHANADEKYEGVVLGDLLTNYGAPLGKELRGLALGYYVVATGSDGYQAVFSLAEVDPSFHPGDVLVADTMDGKSLDAHAGPLRLVVTEDKRPARGVRNLVTVELKAAQ
jgi:hypothetical protein